MPEFFQDDSSEHHQKELEQEKEFLTQLNRSLEDSLEKLKITNESLQKNLLKSVKNDRESGQEHIIQNEIIKEQSN